MNRTIVLQISIARTKEKKSNALISKKIKYNLLPLYTRNWDFWSVVNSLVPSSWLKYAELTGLSCSKVCKHLSLRGTFVSVPSVKFRTSQILTELSVEVVANSHGSRGLYWMLVTLLLWSLSRHIFSPLDERRVTCPKFSPKGIEQTLNSH